MAWVTPKTDWVAYNQIRTGDFNRIEGDTEYNEVSLQTNGSSFVALSTQRIVLGPCSGSAIYITISAGRKLYIESIHKQWPSAGKVVILFDGDEVYEESSSTSQLQALYNMSTELYDNSAGLTDVSGAIQVSVKNPGRTDTYLSDYYTVVTVAVGD